MKIRERQKERRGAEERRFSKAGKRETASYEQKACDAHILTFTLHAAGRREREGVLLCTRRSRLAGDICTEQYILMIEREEREEIERAGQGKGKQQRIGEWKHMAPRIRRLGMGESDGGRMYRRNTEKRSPERTEKSINTSNCCRKGRRRID